MSLPLTTSQRSALLDLLVGLLKVYTQHIFAYGTGGNDGGSGGGGGGGNMSGGSGSSGGGGIGGVVKVYSVGEHPLTPYLDDIARMLTSSLLVAADKEVLEHNGVVIPALPGRFCHASSLAYFNHYLLYICFQTLTHYWYWNTAARLNPHYQVG